MNDSHLLPPQQDIDWALSVEKSLKPSEKSIYLEYLDNKPMSVRKSARELRDGCILTGLFVRSVRNNS
jgi:hypothetical protein